MIASQLPDSSWFGPLEPERANRPPQQNPALARLWRSFMTGRAVVAVLLLLLQAGIYMLGAGGGRAPLVLWVGYLAATLLVRLFARPRAPGRNFDRQWVYTIGVDVAVFSALQLYQQVSALNYTPLFALPVLLAAVLGSLLLALGTAAGVTLILLGAAWHHALLAPAAATSEFLQQGLTGMALFIVALITHQLAARLVREEVRARRSGVAARIQTLVSELVIESLTDGVLVVDRRNMVRAANPAALQLLGGRGAPRHAPFPLDADPAWHGVADLARLTFLQRGNQLADLAIEHAGHNSSRVRARTRLTPSHDGELQSLCVMFLQDLREMEARLRTERLAAMGRVSAAVAHEIRNPLAAIAQANALLDEELTEPAHKRLSQMVRQNAQRLSRIVDDVRDVSRVQDHATGLEGAERAAHGPDRADRVRQRTVALVVAARRDRHLADAERVKHVK